MIIAVEFRNSWKVAVLLLLYPTYLAFIVLFLLRKG